MIDILQLGQIDQAGRAALPRTLAPDNWRLTVAADHDVRIIRRQGASILSRAVGKAASFSEALAAEFHEPLIGVPIREEDDRAWLGRAGDLSNEYGTNRGSDRDHDRNSGHGPVPAPGHHRRRDRASRGRVRGLGLPRLSSRGQEKELKSRRLGTSLD